MIVAVLIKYHDRGRFAEYDRKYLEPFDPERTVMGTPITSRPSTFLTTRFSGPVYFLSLPQRFMRPVDAVCPSPSGGLFCVPPLWRSRSLRMALPAWAM